MTWSDFRSNFTGDWRRVDWGRTALLVLLVLASFAALWQYAMPEVRTIETTTFRKVPAIPGTTDVARTYMPCPEQGIQVLDKAALGKRVDLGWLKGGDIEEAMKAGESLGQSAAGEVFAPLPGGTSPAAQATRDLQITAAGELPESPNGYQQLSVIDPATGVSELVAREKPAPWFQFRNDGAVGIRYGLNQHLQNVGTVYGRWDFLRIKDCYLSANANLETGGDATVQLGLEYRW